MQPVIHLSKARFNTRSSIFDAVQVDAAIFLRIPIYSLHQKDNGMPLCSKNWTASPMPCGETNGFWVAPATAN